MSSDVEKIGAPFDGSRYRLLGPVGSGGMGQVYLARHVALQGEVAVKVLHPAYSGRADLADRMRLEGQALAQLKDPNVVQILDAGQTSTGRPFLVMERLRGRTVWQQIVQQRRIPLSECLDWTRQTLMGLSSVHSAGIVHRDIKPSNLFLCDAPNGRHGERARVLKLIDFGIAKVLDTAPEKNAIRPLSLPTTDGHFVGTPVALAPEQARGEPVDHRADLYSTGLVLYRLVTGRHPFGDLSGSKLLRAYREREVPPPSSTLPDIDPSLERVLLKALQLDPRARFQSAAEFLEQLLLVGRSLPRPANAASLVARSHLAEPLGLRAVDSQALTVTGTHRAAAELAGVVSSPLAGARGLTGENLGRDTTRVAAIQMATEPVPGLAREPSSRPASGPAAAVNTPSAFANTEPTSERREPTVPLTSGDSVVTRTAPTPVSASVALAKRVHIKRSTWSFLFVLCISAATVAGLLFVLLGK